MKAKKNNKVYDVDDITKKSYLNDGYDIYDDKGKLIENAPNKKVTYSEYLNKIEELKKANAEIEELKKTK